MILKITYNHKEFDFDPEKIREIKISKTRLSIDNIEFDLSLKLMFYINKGVSCIWVSRIREPIDILEVFGGFADLFRNTKLFLQN